MEVSVISVSYTHLDVYKRQGKYRDIEKGNRADEGITCRGKGYGRGITLANCFCSVMEKLLFIGFLAIRGR